MNNYLKYICLRLKNRIKVYGLILQGIKIHRPETIQIRGNLSLGKKITMDSDITFKKNVVLSDSVIIEQNCTLEDCIIGENVHIKSNSIIKGSTIKSNSFIGPYARIRPKTMIGSSSQIGNFVEIKNSTIGNNCRINHLTFIGDTKIENDVTIGAGTITCNYDGANTQKTYIEKEAFIGSGVFLIAPIRIGHNATIGSGSTITKNVPPNKLTLARTKQTTIENWQGPQIK